MYTKSFFQHFMFKIIPSQIDITHNIMYQNKKKMTKEWHGYCYLNKVIRNCQVLSTEESTWRVLLQSLSIE